MNTRVVPCAPWFALLCAWFLAVTAIALYSTYTYSFPFVISLLVLLGGYASGLMLLELFARTGDPEVRSRALVRAINDPIAGAVAPEQEESGFQRTRRHETSSLNRSLKVRPNGCSGQPHVDAGASSPIMRP
ncbi:MAG: hypothetical protein AB7K24_25145 [Gemmataceae bacterium]